MDDLKVIKIADFFKIPGARHREDGDNSAQEFFEDTLKIVADETLVDSKKGRLRIDLDDTIGYPSSFISELSMLMSKEYKKIPRVNKRIEIISQEDPGLIESFWYGFKQNYGK